MKKCTKCLTEKPFTDFPIDKSTKTGYHSICKNCKNLARRTKISDFSTKYVVNLQEDNGTLKQDGALMLDEQGFVRKKRCRVCKELKDAVSYARDKAGEGGLRSSCTSCYYHKRARWSPNAKTFELEELKTRVIELEKKVKEETKRNNQIASAFDDVDAIIINLRTQVKFLTEKVTNLVTITTNIQQYQSLLSETTGLIGDESI